MKKLTILVAVILFGVVASASAQVPAKPFTIYAAAGLSSPMSPDSSFKDAVKMGFHADAQLGFSTFPKGEFLLNLGYHTFSADTDYLAAQLGGAVDGGKNSLIMAGGDFKLNLGAPMVPIKPFILAGVGIAVSSQSDMTIATGPLAGTSTVESQNDFYFQVGGGIEFTQFFVRVKYVSVATEGSSTAFVPLSIGLKF